MNRRDEGMQKDSLEKIGAVTLDYSHYPGEDYYCDGAAEDELLEIVRNVRPAHYAQAIREKKSWEVLYHLSDLRENIVAWLPMDRTMKVLEVGSGCGAVTGCLAGMAGSVTCVDLSRKRSLINAYRHQDCENVTIHVGNFSDIEPDLPADYDYVCLIGVFEYGQSYIGGETPFHDFYKIIRKHVKPGGRIVIAIENKMGLKYWAGCREDHLGTFFSGLEDYPGGGAVRTFTRSGLEKILTDCGETQYRFYYPYPDYKFMTMLYSDRYLPRVGELSNNLRNFDRDRMLLFDEKRVFDMLIRENLFPLYSNSFLVLTGPEIETVYSRFSNDRAARYCIRTDIGQRPAGGRYVRKFPARPEAQAHIRKLADNYRHFSERYAAGGLEMNRLRMGWEAPGVQADVPYVELEFLENAGTLEERLDDCLQKNDEVGFRTLFSRYRDAVLGNAFAARENVKKESGEAQDGSISGGKMQGDPASGGAGQDGPVSSGEIQNGFGGAAQDSPAPSGEAPQDFDLIFPNICVQGEKWTVIDYEWAAAGMRPQEIVQRALYCYVLENGKRKEHPILQRVLAEQGMDAAAFARLARQEAAFQEAVMREEDGSLRTAVTDLRHLIGHLALPFQEAFSLIANKKAEIFEDYGEGYSPDHSYHLHNAYISDNLLCVRIFCGEGVKGIRVDPAEEPCLVHVRRVLLGDRPLTGEELARAVVTNGEILDGSGRPDGKAARPAAHTAGGVDGYPGAELPAVFFDTADPNINIRLDGLEERPAGELVLTLEAWIIRPDERMLQDLRTRIVRRKRLWFQK